MKILFVDHLADLGGAEINLLNIVSNLDPQRVQPVITCPGEGPFPDKIRELGIPFVPLTRHRDWGATNMLRNAGVLATITKIIPVFGGYLRVIANLRAIIVREAPDLVYLNTLKAGVFGGVASKLAGVPMVQHVQDIVSPESMNPIFRFIQSGCFRFLNHPLIAISDAVKLSLAQLRVEPSRIARIYNGLDLCRFSPRADSAAIKREFGLPPDMLTVGIVARLMRWKGQEVFIEAISRVHSDARFFIVGGLFWEEREYENELKALAARLGVGHKVEFLGHRDDIPNIMNLLDVVVHASIRPEPFGLTIIEAMAAARPVIGTRGGGVPEIISHGETGYLVEPNNPDEMAQRIDQLLENPRLRADMGKAARQRVEKYFDITQTARGIEGFLAFAGQGKA